MSSLFEPLPIEAAQRRIKERAQALADYCLQIIERGATLESSYSRCATVAQIHEVTPRAVKAGDYRAAFVRLSSTDWWQRQLSNAQGKRLERDSIQQGRVHRFAQLYVSDETIRRRDIQKSRNRRFVEARMVINENHDEYELLDMVNRSTANPKNKRAELMCRIAGFEKIAQDSNHAGLFLTFTCPSRMHARLSRSGDANPVHDGTSPDAAQKYLTTVWARIRAKLNRDGVHCYGVRIAEPQHDGTPHWHLLLFTADQNARELERVCTLYNLVDSSEERGAKQHRVKCEVIDWNKGTATGYIAKYVAKNIDGAYIEEDSFGLTGVEAARRVEAWAAVWSIRQFQCLGGPSVQIWRELRRTKGTGNGIIDAAFQAADAGDWSEFVKITGGPECYRKDRPIWLTKVWSDEPNRYNEARGYEVCGVESAESKLSTRNHVWKIVSKRDAYVAERSAAA